VITDPHEYSELEGIFQLEAERFQLLLPKSDIETVEHYLRNAELEMAFESLGLSLMRHQLYPSTESAECLKRLGLLLNLDTESVFDDQFWSRFICFLQTDHS